MKIILTIHAKEKLKNKENNLLGIRKVNILRIIKEPIEVDKTLSPHRSIGRLNKTLSLVVIWKTEDGIIKVITFYPAEKGRYESKVL